MSRRPLLGGELAALYSPERGPLTWWRGDVSASPIAHWVYVARILEARQRCAPRATVEALCEGLAVPAYLVPYALRLVDQRHLVERLRRYEDVYDLTWHVEPLISSLSRDTLEADLGRAYSWGLVYLPESQQVRRCYK